MINFELINTWPGELVELLQREMALLDAYERRRQEIDALCRDDVMARINVPRNDHAHGRASIVEKAGGILARHRLQCFHCTRLTEDEIARIKEQGLRPLTEALVCERLQRALDEGLFTASIMKQLLATQQARDPYRAGMTHFVNCQSVLASESDVGRLFRSWGGEALYWSHENRDDTGPVLRSIGKPSIVIAGVPFSKLRTWGSIGERFVWRFLRERGVSTDHAGDLETHTTESVSPEFIIDIISMDDAKFDELIHYSEWSVPIS